MKKRIGILLRWLIDSNLLIALAAVAFTDAGWKVLNGRSDSATTGIYILIFLGALFSYNLYSPFLKSSSRQRWLILISIFFLLLISILMLSLFQFAYLAHLGILVFFYDFSFHFINKYHKRSHRLRSIPLLKIFVISYVWASLGSVLPAILEGTNWFDSNIIWLFIANFCLITGITIPFDIRDLAKDKADQVNTFPGLFGIGKAKMISILLLTIFVVCFGMVPGSTFPAIFLFIPAAMLVLFAEPNLHRYYFSGLIDGLLIFFWWLVVIIG
jgi:4-hydroxybenzoate polyprenyltransferase